MKYLLVLFFFPFCVRAQTPALTQPVSSNGWTNPNPSSYGTIAQGLIIWKQLGFPTGNGAPTGVQKYDVKTAYLYMDSTSGTVYTRNPKTGTWSALASGGTGGVYHLPYNGDSTYYLGGDSALHVLPVSGGGTGSNDPDSLGGKAAADYEIIANKQTTLDNSATHYPSTSAVTTALAAKQNLITGLTNNYIPFWNSTALNNTGLYWTGTRLGIGTTTPFSQLHIKDLFVSQLPNNNSFGGVAVFDERDSLGVTFGYASSNPSTTFLANSAYFGNRQHSKTFIIGSPVNNWNGAYPIAYWDSDSSYTNLGKGTFNDTLTATTMGNADSSNRVASTAFVKRVAGTGGGLGSTNTNIGSGYRIAVNGTNNIKTVHAGTNVTIDSATNTNELTINASGTLGIDSLQKSNKNVVSARKNSAFVPQYTMGDTSVLYLKDFLPPGYTDSSTDVSPALGAVQSSLPSRGGTIIVGAGVFMLPTGFTVTKAITFQGQGGGGLNTTNPFVVTKFATNSATVDMFIVNADNVRFRDIGFQNTNSTPTAGSAMNFKDGHGFILDGFTVDGFYNNVDMRNSYNWSILNGNITGWVNYGIRIRDSIYPDAGDPAIFNVYFTPHARDCIAGICQESGGGLKLTVPKFNQGTDGRKMQYGFYGNFTGGTSDFVAIGGSYENISKKAFYIVSNGLFGGHLIINSNQIALYNSVATSYIELGSGFSGATLMGNQIQANNALVDTAIYFNTIGAIACANSYYLFSSPPTVYTGGSINTLIDNSSINTANKILFSKSATTGQIGATTAGWNGYALTLGSTQIGDTSYVRTMATSDNSTAVASTAFVKAALAAGGTTPGGSTGYVQFNNAGAFGSNSNLFWDNTNSRLGVGSTSPATNIQAYSTTAGGGIRVDGTGNNAYTMAVGGSLKFYLALASSSGAFLTDATNGDVLFNTLNASNGLLFGNGTSWFKVSATQSIFNTKVGVGVSTPTANLHLKAGTATANTAPLKLTAGTSLTTPEAGAVEFDGTNYFVTVSTTRYILTKTLTGTAAPTTTPVAVGDHFIDTTNKKEYVATGISSSADWTILN